MGAPTSPVVNELVQKIVRQLQERLATPEVSSEALKSVIEMEVKVLIASGQVSDSTETVAQLEQRIRGRMARESVSTLARCPPSAEKSTKASADEWGRLARYAALLQKTEERTRALEACVRAQRAQAEMKEQQAALKLQKAKEKEAKQNELAKIRAEVEAWRREEVAKREARRAAAEATKRDRKAQLEDLHRRQQMSQLLRQAAEAHAAFAARQDARRASELDRKTRAAARRELESVLQGNLAAQFARVQSHQKEQEEDRRFMAQYAEILERQEAERAAQQERIRKIQMAQAADAATRPPVKRWLDDGLIERQALVAEEKAKAGEALKATQLAAVTRRCFEEVAEQLHERERCRAAKEEEKMADLKSIKAAAAAYAAQQSAAAEASVAARRRLKKDLDQQVIAHAVSRLRDGDMSEAERRLNAKALQDAAAVV